MKFDSVKYYPCVRTRQAELLGIKELKDTTKSQIIPILSLTKMGRNKESSEVLLKWFDVFNGPTIISLPSDHLLFCDDTESLLSEEQNFANWFAFLKQYSEKNIIPTAIINSTTNKRQFVQQIKELENEFGKFAVRINPMSNRAIQAITSAASVVDDISNILIILDSEQINRERQQIALDATIRCINQLRQLDQSIEIVVTGTSFPRRFKPYGETHGQIPMLEWDNFHALGGEDVAIYGDYAGTHGKFYAGSFAQLVARVDYVTRSFWLFERNVGNEPIEIIYQNLAIKIKTNDSWRDALDCWGVDIINKVAKGNVDGFKSPAKWVSVRVNLHIESIVSFLNNEVQWEFKSTSEEESDFDWDDWDE